MRRKPKLNLFALSCLGNNESVGIVVSWDNLDERSQLALSRAALDRAIGIVACGAENLASEIESGSITDQGGVEALRLFATLTRCASLGAGGTHSQIAHGQVGHA